MLDTAGAGLGFGGHGQSSDSNSSRSSAMLNPAASRRCRAVSGGGGEVDDQLFAGFAVDFKALHGDQPE
jgi:hypothetical protein